MNKQYLFLFGIFLLVFTISNFSASLGYDDESLGFYKQDSCINIIQTCENCSYINITSIAFPNSAIAVSDVSMNVSANGLEYNHSFCLTNTLGEYKINFNSDEDGVTTNAKVWFDVTANGREKPSDFLTTFFIILYLCMLGYFLFFISNTLMFFVQFKLEEHERGIVFGLDDIFYNLAGYFVLIGYFYLAVYYLGNPQITYITSWFLRIAAFTNIFLPVIAFVLSFVIWGGMSALKWSNEQG